MKKRLEAELISIAHRILKLKNKSEVDQLYKETQKLYETLAVLKFYQDSFESVKSDVAADVLEEKLTAHIENETPQEITPEVEQEATEPETEITEAQPETEEEIEEALAEESTVSESAEEPVSEEVEIEEEETPVAEEPTTENEAEEKAEETVTEEDEKPALAFQPIFGLEEEEETEEEEIEPAETASELTPETKPTALEHFLGESYVDPVFVKPNEVSLFSSSETEVKEEPKTEPIHESTQKSLAIGLNDRIGFVKHLFGESNEDFNRVLSQLNTFDSFEEAKNFIDDMVKPDYNNWQGEEDFAERFMELIANKFQ